ncbi:MAG: sigma-70 family RNA polymerase sigma factor [Deltaproteobacteria bacterium]|nr:sigma-70 family RNA polymerase sigma factor [Deltaproteobacteria bacterium]
MIDDAALLDAWRAGDRDAGDALIGRHFDAVCRFFRSKLGDDVEDLVQRTFLDCVESRERIRHPSFVAYLFGVARNRLFDHLRRELRRPTEALGERSIADIRTHLSGRLARAQHHALVVRAMQALPVDFQIALELAYWEDLSGAEIASVLQIPANTVRSRLSRGRALLRERVQTLAAQPAERAQTLATLQARLPAHDPSR